MTKDHETEPDDLVERLEDSKGWPNLGKAAAARIRELEAENARLRTDDLVERLEDSKSSPNLFMAAAARIRLDAEVIKAAEALAEAADMCLPATDEPMSKDQALRLATALYDFRQAQQARAEKGGE